MTIQHKPLTPLFLLPFVFFVGIPFLFLSSNLADITRVDISLYLTLGVLALVSIGALLFACLICRSHNARFWLISLVEPLCFFVIVAGYVFSLSVSTGMIDPREVPVNWSNLGLVVLSVALMTWWANSRYGKLLYAGLVLFVGLNFAHAVFEVQSTLSQQGGTTTLHELSTTKNILVLSLDGISNSAAVEVLENNSELAQSFRGFTVFDRAASSSPSTDVSLVTSLYGNQNLKLRFETMDQVLAGISKGLLSNYLNENGYLVSTFGFYGKGFGHARQQAYSSTARSLDVTMLLNFTIGRTFTGRLAYSGDLLGELEDRLQIGSRPLEESRFLEKIAKAKTPDWKKRFAAEFLDLEHYLQRLNVGTSRPVAHFTHFTFTHYPVDFDRDCSYRGNDEQWSLSRQNRAGVKEETVCALSKFAKFIFKIKELGVFDQSLIVLKSDHGKPPGYYEEDSIFSRKIQGHSALGYGRYEPFFAIKGLGPSSGPLQKNSSSVLLDDMARTICLAALDGPRCDQYAGLDLLAPNLDPRESSEVTMFIVGSDSSNWRFRTWQAVTVNRQPDILQNLYEYLLVEKKVETE